MIISFHIFKAHIGVINKNESHISDMVDILVNCAKFTPGKRVSSCVFCYCVFKWAACMKLTIAPDTVQLQCHIWFLFC